MAAERAVGMDDLAVGREFGEVRWVTGLKGMGTNRHVGVDRDSVFGVSGRPQISNAPLPIVHRDIPIRLAEGVTVRQRRVATGNAQRLEPGPARHLHMPEAEADDHLYGGQQIRITGKQDKRVILLPEGEM